MQPAFVRHTEIPGTSRLFADFLYRFDRVAEFFAPHQGARDPYAHASREFPDERRAALVKALREQNGNSGELESLAQPGTLAVVTGQQVGLFTGPCYAVYKALTAARIARELTDRGIPAVPVFWMATEDHDADEVNHCHVFDHRLTPSTLQVDTGGHAQVPVGGIPIRNPPLKELRGALSGMPYGDEVAAITEESYAQGRSLGEAFRELMNRILGSQKLLYLDPMSDSLRRLAAPFLERSLKAMPELVSLVLERNRKLEAAGYHAQVHVERASSLLFALRDNRRIPLGKLRPEPDRLSPNALLRPVMQDYLLPTAAYVGGPGEIAYLAQSQVLYRRLGIPMPVIAARAGFTLLEARAVKLMKRYELSLSGLLRDRDALLGEVAGKLVPAEVEAAYQEAHAAVEGAVGRFRTSLAGFDPTLAAALDTSRSKILHQLNKIHRKTGREAMHRQERAGEEAEYLHHLVYPERHLQERYYTILPFVARHGLDLIAALHENVRPDGRDHIVLPV